MDAFHWSADCLDALDEGVDDGHAQGRGGARGEGAGVREGRVPPVWEPGPSLGGHESRLLHTGSQVHSLVSCSGHLSLKDGNHIFQSLTPPPWHWQALNRPVTCRFQGKAQTSRKSLGARV